MEEQDPSGNVIELTRRALFDIMQELKGKKIDAKFSFLDEKLIIATNCPDNETRALNHSLKYFKSDFKKKWAEANYKEERFVNKNEKWLAVSIKFPTWATHRPGRPSKEFVELSDRSKRRKTKHLREQIPADELTYAARVSQRAVGNVDASKLIQDITASPTRARKLRKAITSAQIQPTVKKHTPQEALEIFVEGDFTRKQWEVIHKANKNIYPCYSLIKKAKMEAYPNEESMRVTETCAEIKLQALLDHTSLRLCKYTAEVIQTCTEEEKQNLELITKWGCDGSQQSQFKQKFENSTDSDANIFQSSLVPIKLAVVIAGEEQKIIWQNPVPSSVRFCRPIRIRFIHETKDITKEEIKYVEDQARNLNKTQIPTPGGIVEIKHTLLPTMVDGKVCNAATDTASTMRCYICKQTSKDFNKLQFVIYNYNL